jgi:uncharacterized protein (DUF952 family)
MAEGMSFIYRILSRGDWQAAQAAGEFRGTAHDLRDGFIHFSAAHQVVDTAAKHYAGRSDLLLLFVDDRALVAADVGALTWEVSRGGDRFPHLYGALPVQLVQRIEELPLGADGKHIFPELFTGSRKS